MLDAFAQGLIEALVTTVAATHKEALRLPPGYDRRGVEELLVRLLVNIDLLEEFMNAMFRRFDALPVDDHGLTGEEQHTVITRGLKLPALAFVRDGLPALGEESVVSLMVDAKAPRLAHELLAEANAARELSPYWAAAIAGLPAEVVKFTDDFDVLK